MFRCQVLSAKPILAGFMTHMCANSTARGAFELGYAPTVVAPATATRPLLVTGEVVSPASLQVASLAALADLLAVVVPDRSATPGCSAAPAHRATVRP